jgi:hypothetical protein
VAAKYKKFGTNFPKVAAGFNNLINLIDATNSMATAGSIHQAV